MSYLKAKEYAIIPTETYKILRNCSGCGDKSIYHCTNKFRVNANGKLIDVWLIYQCGQCKHTYNLPVYSRINRDTLDKTEYEALQKSDAQIVHRYALDRKLFQRSGAKIHSEPSYVLENIGETTSNTVLIRNPYHIRIRHDKLMAECLGISRLEVKRMLEDHVICVKTKSNDEVIFSYIFAESGL